MPNRFKCLLWLLTGSLCQISSLFFSCQFFCFFFFPLAFTLFIPSNSQWVASLGPNNAGTKRSKVGVGHEKPDKNAYISTDNTAVLPSLCDTLNLQDPSLFTIKHPYIVRVVIFMLAIKIHRKYIPNALETNISLTSHSIFSDLNIRTMQ